MIHLDRVSKRYGAVHALREVTLTIPAGLVYGFIGPNGAGKTTALRIMAGLARPTSGRVTIEGGPVGYLPQRVELNGLATPRETLRLFACLRRLPATAADEAIEAAALGHCADRQIRVLSGGLRQRVGVAIACLGNPAILLLDEPTAGLDPRAAVLWRREMRRLADAGRTVVVCSHSLPELQSVCRRIAIVVDGCVVREGAVDELTHGRADALDELFMDVTA